MIGLRYMSIVSMVSLMSACASNAATESAAMEKAESSIITPEQYHQQALENPPQMVSPETLAQWLQAKSVTLIDLRSKEEFDQGHIQGAIHIPLTDLTELELEKRGMAIDQRLVIYCDYQLEPTRRLALTTLAHPSVQQFGYENVYTLEPLWSSPECKAANHDVPCADLLPMASSKPK